MSKTKTVSIKAVEVSADDELGITIDSENHNTRALDPSQIAMLSITPEDQKPEESTPENKLVKFPSVKIRAIGMYPLECLLNALKVAKKSGAIHIKLFMGKGTPLIVAWNFEAVGKPNEDDPAPIRGFEAFYYLAPRIDGDYSEPHGGMELPPKAVFEELKPLITEEVKP